MVEAVEAVLQIQFLEHQLLMQAAVVDQIHQVALEAWVLDLQAVEVLEETMEQMV